MRIIIVLLILSSAVFAQIKDADNLSPKASDIKIDFQWYISYLSGVENKSSFNEFALKRGYVTIKNRINDIFSARITSDITRDKEGDGKGDVEMRVKYLHLKSKLPSFGFFYQPFFEIGLVHRPWLDFEEHINFYRVQGTMFLERNHIFNSADYGIVFFALLGGEMDSEYKKTVNKNYAGKYGSIAFGILNGGGYHALENNKNKSFEGRLTLRPLPTMMPGLQMTYHGAIGRGNIEQEPIWDFGSAFISYESSALVFTATSYHGNGNSQGTAISDTVSFSALSQRGYSIFSEWKLYNSKFSIIGRYDFFRTPEWNSKRLIAGLAVHFASGSKLLLDYDTVSYSDGRSGSDIFEVAIELKY